jgi:hypothetical protein
MKDRWLFDHSRGHRLRQGGLKLHQALQGGQDLRLRLEVCCVAVHSRAQPRDRRVDLRVEIAVVADDVALELVRFRECLHALAPVSQLAQGAQTTLVDAAQELVLLCHAHLPRVLEALEVSLVLFLVALLQCLPDQVETRSLNGLDLPLALLPLLQLLLRHQLAADLETLRVITVDRRQRRLEGAFGARTLDHLDLREAGRETRAPGERNERQELRRRAGPHRVVRRVRVGLRFIFAVVRLRAYRLGGGLPRRGRRLLGSLLAR